MTKRAESAPERRRGERRTSTDTRFWRALQGERRVAERRRDAAPAGEPPAPDASTIAPSPPPAEEKRREALRAMLRASEARRERIARTRRPVLAEGMRVRVTSGELADLSGVILDADYIESRALVRLDEREQPSWVPFPHLAPS